MSMGKARSTSLSTIELFYVWVFFFLFLSENFNQNTLPVLQEDMMKQRQGKQLTKGHLVSSDIGLETTLLLLLPKKSLLLEPNRWLLITYSSFS